jgi:hypothetical protein
MRAWRYHYKNKAGALKTIRIEETTRRKADARFAAITGCFEAEKIEDLPDNFQHIGAIRCLGPRQA